METTEKGASKLCNGKEGKVEKVSDIGISSTSLKTLDHTKAQPLELATQGEFFPLRTSIELPGSVQGADAWGLVTAHDTHDYVVKRTLGGASVPACELICTQLAEALNVACPSFKIIELNCGELAFGSRVISHISDKIRTTEILTTLSVFSGTTPRGLTHYLSEVYALDMFIGNVDRHDHNFITIEDNGVTRFFLIDFGRSLLWNDDLMAIPQPHHSTVIWGRVFRDRHGFDVSSALGMLDRIAALSNERFAAIVNSVPSDWLPASQKQILLRHWGGVSRQEKVSRLRKGFVDGSLL